MVQGGVNRTTEEVDANDFVEKLMTLLKKRLKGRT